MRLSENFKRVRRGIGSGVLALSLTAGLAGTVHAFSFDADGIGGSAAINNVTALDWGPSSFLALNGVSAIQNFLGGGPAAGNNFDVITHAKLVAIIDTGNNNVIPFSFLGATPTTEMTMTARFSETVTSVIGNTAQFAVDTTKALFIEIYFDTSPDSVAVSGAGFTDGKLILKGTLLLNASGNFSVTQTNPTVNLDQSNGDSYNGQQTVTGQGNQGNLSVGGLSTDSNFFVNALAAFGLQFANASLALPFISVDPSDCFADYAAATGSGATIGGADNTSDCANNHTNAANMAGQGLDGGFRPNIGAVNGLFVAGPTDFMAQTDFNSPLTPAVPEPASFFLLGAGLLGMGGYARRRNRKSE